MPARSATSPDPVADLRRAARPRFSGPNASSASTVAPTICLAGSWSTVPTVSAIVAQLAARSSAGRRPGRAPRQLARVGVRDQPVDRPDQRALAAARRAGHEQDLARRRRSARGRGSRARSLAGSGTSGPRPRRAARAGHAVRRQLIRAGRSTRQAEPPRGVALVVGERQVALGVGHQQRRPDRHAAERDRPRSSSSRPLGAPSVAGKSSASGRPGASGPIAASRSAGVPANVTLPKIRTWTMTVSRPPSRTVAVGSDEANEPLGRHGRSDRSRTARPSRGGRPSARRCRGRGSSR